MGALARCRQLERGSADWAALSATAVGWGSASKSRKHCMHGALWRGRLLTSPAWKAEAQCISNQLQQQAKQPQSFTKLVKFELNEVKLSVYLGAPHGQRQEGQGGWVQLHKQLPVGVRPPKQPADQEGGLM